MEANMTHIPMSTRWTDKQSQLIYGPIWMNDLNAPIDSLMQADRCHVSVENSFIKVLEIIMSHKINIQMRSIII